MIDFTSKDFRFVSKEDEDPYWVPGTVVVCEDIYDIGYPDLEIESCWGFFRGLTMVSYESYTGELPRVDGDTSGFDEFDVYYKDVLIENMKMTYMELDQFMKSIDRNDKINKILR
jgi:hypothetical protein